MNTYVCIDIYIFTYTHIYIYIYQGYKCIYVCIHTYTYIYINIRSICMECTLFYASDVLGINTYIYLFIFIYTYIYIYTCIQSYISEVSGCSAPYSARVVLGIYVCIYGINICPLYVYIHNYAWMNIYI